MLAKGPYPPRLKQRVGGDYGHLNNQQAAELLDTIDLERLHTLVISHISEQNNEPELALAAIKGHLKNWTGNLVLANQNDGLSWIKISV